MNRHFERKECFSAASCKVLQSFVRISHGSESSVFVERRLNNYRMSVGSLWFLNLFKKLGNLKFGNFDPLRMITASC